MRYYLYGEPDRLVVGERCATSDVLFNTNSGRISVGDDTIFGHRCMVLTGRHRFHQGKRVDLWPAGTCDFPEIADEGCDITIGTGCFIGSGSIILAGVEIGDNSIIGAGSVVTRSVPPGCFAAGNPASVIKQLSDDEEDADGA